VILHQRSFVENIEVGSWTMKKKKKKKLRMSFSLYANIAIVVVVDCKSML
jgi:hypothetical protein